MSFLSDARFHASKAKELLRQQSGDSLDPAALVHAQLAQAFAMLAAIDRMDGS